MPTEYEEIMAAVDRQDVLDETIDEVGAEVSRAGALHPTPIHSAHEAWGIIREEYLEIEHEICRKKLHRSRLRGELIQLAAMCVRTILDLELEHVRLEDQVGYAVLMGDAA